MGFTLSILKETAKNEARVAATPETVKKYIALGARVLVEKGAGAGASIPDSEYKQAGAEISESVKNEADILLCVQADVDTLDGMKEGAILIGQLSPYTNSDLIEKAKNKKITAFSMELVPRITRAQAMDVLSSQSNLAGYKSVLDAAEHYGKSFPMMMTAAGTVPPAKVFVMGAGVAGLQATKFPPKNKSSPLAEISLPLKMTNLNRQKRQAVMPRKCRMSIKRSKPP